MTDEELAAVKARAERFENFDTEGDTEWLATATDSATDVPKLVAEIERLRATLRDRDDELRIRDQEDAESEDMEQRAITADRRRGKAQAEVARLQGIIDQVRAWAEDNDHELTTFLGEVIHTNAGLFAILDGEEQS